MSQAPVEISLTGKERRALISHLSEEAVTPGSDLVLSPRQKEALRQEVELRRRGHAPWADPSPWQRLSRHQQLLFNEKYLALPRELQVSLEHICNAPNLDKDDNFTFKFFFKE